MDSHTPDLRTAQHDSSLQRLVGAMSSSRGGSVVAVVAVVLMALVVRCGVALNPHSGEGMPPLHGDFEAQRHWMEVTVGLPVSQWYVNGTDNDLQYWGLDYPPLTAYGSWFCGQVAKIVDPSIVALGASRGSETASTKLFMRATVFASDLLLYLPFLAWYFARRLPTRPVDKIATFALAAMQPGLILIDHGHFQYNCISLGLCLLAVVLIANDRDLLGGAAFVLSLNYKQMNLYYSPAFFFFLLNKSLRAGGSPLATGVWKVVKLGIVVIATFAILWAPFLYPNIGDATQVLRRVFPFERGLFEDKVANFWCVLSFVFKYRRFLSVQHILRLSTFLTLLGLVPVGVDCLRRRPTQRQFILALFNSSMAFFLFSFQAHEKTILLPLLPFTLLIAESPFHTVCVAWLNVVGAFSMYPLLRKDRQVTCYVVCTALFLSMALESVKHAASHLPTNHRDHVATARALRGLKASLLAMLLFHAAELAFVPPPRYPDLHLYAQTAFAFAHFVGAWVVGLYWQWTDATDDSLSTPAASLSSKAAVTCSARVTRSKAKVA